MRDPESRNMTVSMKLRFDNATVDRYAAQARVPLFVYAEFEAVVAPEVGEQLLVTVCYAPGPEHPTDKPWPREDQAYVVTSRLHEYVTPNPREMGSPRATLVLYIAPIEMPEQFAHLNRMLKRAE